MSTQSALERLRLTRATGDRNYKLPTYERIYEEVDDEAFREAARKNLAENFIVNDDDSGYIDNGLDIWDQGHRKYGNSASSDEDEMFKPDQKRSKKKRNSNGNSSNQGQQNSNSRKAKKPVDTRSAEELAMTAAHLNPYVKPDISKQSADELLGNIFAGLDATVASNLSTPPTSMNTKRHPQRPHKPKTRMQHEKHVIPVVEEPTPELEDRDHDNSETMSVSSDVLPHTSDPAMEMDIDGMNDFDFDLDVDDFDVEDSFFSSNIPILDDSEMSASSSLGSFPNPAGNSVEGPLAVSTTNPNVNSKPGSSSISNAFDQQRKILATPRIDIKRREPQPPQGASTLTIPSTHKEPELLKTPNKKDQSDSSTLINQPTNVGFQVAEVLDTPELESFSGHDLQSRPDTQKGLTMYWFDYAEDRHGVIQLFGKILLDSGHWVTGSVAVSGFKHTLYVYPRDKIIDPDWDASDDGESSDAGSDMAAPNREDVEDEIDEILKDASYKGSYTKEWVKRNYAFDIPEVPTGENLDFLKVTLNQRVPTKLNDKVDGGRSFAHIFGTSTNLFEILALEQGIMGPCWLHIEGVYPTSGTLTWCKDDFIYGVHSPKHIKPLADDAPEVPLKGGANPPMNVMSLVVRTAVHLKTNKREIISASMRTWKQTDVDTLNASTRATSLRTFYRPLGSRLPPGTEEKTKLRSKRRNEHTIKMSDEKALINGVLDALTDDDIDMLLIYGFGDTLGLLLERMRELGTRSSTGSNIIKNWSRIGRVKRAASEEPPRFWQQSALSGRLVVDLYGDFIRPLFESTTGKLSDLVQVTLSMERTEPDQNEAAARLDPDHSTFAEVDAFLSHMEMDTQYICELASRVQAIPLTRLLTQLAGNSWQRTLEGHRSDRNDFVLLHEFHKRNFVTPDRPRNERSGQGNSKKRGKPKYQGGLVLDPKKGLYDRCVIVLDFNSLYPSVIQEFNIDYTTVDRRSGYIAKRQRDASNLDKANTQCHIQEISISEDNLVTIDDDENSKDQDQANFVIDGASSAAAAATMSSDTDLVIPDVPDPDKPQGILPMLIHKFVSRRREVKALLAKEKNEAQIAMYNIKQNALKLTANTMYGCLGLAGSRFASVEMAALVTMKGRELLGITREKAIGDGLDVIYGDTDSLMINTNAHDIPTAMSIGTKFKTSVNSLYRVLEIDIDALFLRMLLLQKKKYAALKVLDLNRAATQKDTAVSTKMEVKGLDMVRREYCLLSKEASRAILNVILNPELSTELVVEKVHEYLELLAANLRGGSIPLNDLIIFKALSKDIEEYNDKSIQHVQVAISMRARGITVRAGDVIPVVMCKDPLASSGHSDSVVPRHPDDVRSGTAQISENYYLKNQIFQPISRLCEHIQGTDKTRLAEALGVSYHAASDPRDSNLTSSGPLSIAAWQLPDAERFVDAEALVLKCPKCVSHFEIPRLETIADNPAGAPFTPQGDVKCTSCSHVLPWTLVTRQLSLRIRSFINRLYEGWVVCTDPTCGLRTRSLSVVPNSCSRDNCHSPVVLEYSESQLYTQLLYYQALFDIPRRISAMDPSLRGRWDSFKSPRPPTALVNMFLNKSGLYYVDMNRLFSFM